jgi:hypothetical protein
MIGPAFCSANLRPLRNLRPFLRVGATDSADLRRQTGLEMDAPARFLALHLLSLRKLIA